DPGSIQSQAYLGPCLVTTAPNTGRQPSGAPSGLADDTAGHPTSCGGPRTSWIFFWTYASAYAIRHVMVERHVKLFKNGRSQAVRIPREFELPGEDAIMRKDGERLTIEPTPPKSLLAG